MSQTVATSRPTPTRDQGERSDAATPRRRRPRIALGLTLGALTAAFVVPLLLMLSTSFKSPQEANSLTFRLFPENPTLSAYSEILNNPEIPILRWLGNSLLVAVLHCVLVVVLAALAAYALAKMDFRFKKAIFAAIVATMFAPGVIFLIPHFLIVNQLGWLNTYASLVVPSAAGAFGVFFLRQFFLGVHPSIEEAARMDGCNRWATFRRIAVPLAMPAIATLAVLAFLSSWNDFLWPVFVLFSSEMQTLPAGLAQLQGENAARFDLMMAGAVIASLPVLLVYVFAQRYIIDGVAAGGVKG
ncbi:binding-protein-dependent transport systems inner membrane component [Beutenbergia cavernae DSM 12333]|uniref:Binding-protein-dependent transport systems inner membrane component n=1 Tax=Beutenbergia cavernae (strain ATCC BAA-8 / DSM 12333 / CCUG 43141 / JCM 11478 / NBRC 16432 / NCIMB 13614 / HKI 0122) TaxID=471853 RepID=C5BVK5_BEUC1|nr:carbohydrate ABC transporter permease [Beutenbergia cavernae]ACQ78445.1 binding-protein-dependent transport systems inner membrane component [Beutenbergia cavernae DSM 12333]